MSPSGSTSIPKYTTLQAVIHDSRDLSVVYDVIAVKPY